MLYLVAVVDCTDYTVYYSNQYKPYIVALVDCSHRYRR